MIEIKHQLMENAKNSHGQKEKSTSENDRPE